MSSNNNYTADFDYKGVKMTVEYYATPYRPATMYARNGDPGDPEEGGDFDIESVKVGGVEIIELLSDSMIEEITQSFISTDWSDN